MIKKTTILFFLLLISQANLFSQITPICPSPNVYMDGGATIQFYNPALPLSATNPSSTGIPTFGSGLTLMPNINGGALSPTFYVTSGGTYWYWSGTAWVNTGASTGNGSAVNIGGCGCKIYNLVGGTGQVYVSTGSGAGTLLTTITGFNGGGPYDIVTDCNCNFYILKTTTSGGQSLTLYNQTGGVMQTWSLVNMPNATAGGGFAIIGNMVYVKNNLTNGFFIGTMAGASITFTQVTGFNNSPGDFACCPVCNTTPTMAATANNNGPLTCTQLTANCIASTTTTPVTYNWSGPGIVGPSNSATITVNLNGVYTCTVSSPGCPPLQNIITTTVTGNPAAISPTITSSGPITCTNTTSQIIVAPNSATNTIVWAGPGIVSGQGTPTIIANVAGIYSVSITNTVNSCAGTATFNLQNTQAPLNLNVVPLNPVKCSTDPPILHTVTGATSYVWNTSAGVTQLTSNTFSVNPASTTVYTITGTTGVCTGVLITTVTVIPSPTIAITVSSNTLCAQLINGSPNSIQVSGSGGTVYSWTVSPNVSMVGNTNGSPATLVPLMPYPSAPTTATITMMGANGQCSNTTTQVVTIVPNPTITVTPAVANICYGTSASFTASGATNYAWNPGTNLNTVVGPVVVANPLVSTQYNVIGSSAGCFGLMQQAMLNVIPNPTITINPATPTICAGSSINLTANGATSYNWAPSNGLSTTSGQVVSAGPLANETYTILGTQNTCTNVAYITVTVIPVPNLIINATQYTVCAGYPTNLSVNGAQSFSWSPPVGLSGVTGPFVVANPANTTTYTVVGFNGMCMASGSIPIQVIPQPNLNVSSPNYYLCEGQSTTISATGAQSYSWFPAQTLSSSVGNVVVATPATSTNYTVVGYNTQGTITCAEVHSYSIVVIPWASANLPAKVVICEGETAKINVSGGNTYSWVPSTGLDITNGAQVNASPMSGIIYTVYSSYNGNCGGTGTVEVVVNPRPVVFAGRDTTFNLDAYKFIKASGTGTLTWIDGEEIWCHVCPESQIYAKRSGCYVIQAVNQFGCKTNDEVCIDIVTDFGVYIPNIITPNADGVNDIFYVYGYSISDVKMAIFDRWGEKLFTSEDQTVGWPGTYKGVDCKSDVYVYKVEYKGLDGKTYHKTGHVSIQK
ncbi:MAG: hypothetical protein K0S32_2303 [Bacteroidetes bacterium]|jgi:gliding motility-associated-like protein|nr:hypothetical protein [Bacteroidota bacterium]